VAGWHVVPSDFCRRRNARTRLTKVRGAGCRANSLLRERSTVLGHPQNRRRNLDLRRSFFEICAAKVSRAQGRVTDPRRVHKHTCDSSHPARMRTLDGLCRTTNIRKHLMLKPSPKPRPSLKADQGKSLARYHRGEEAIRSVMRCRAHTRFLCCCERRHLRHCLFVLRLFGSNMVEIILRDRGFSGVARRCSSLELKVGSVSVPRGTRPKLTRISISPKVRSLVSGSLRKWLIGKLLHPLQDDSACSRHQQDISLPEVTPDECQCCKNGPEEGLRIVSYCNKRPSRTLTVLPLRFQSPGDMNFGWRIPPKMMLPK
jgi:hypothetical protein